MSRFLIVVTALMCLAALASSAGADTVAVRFYLNGQLAYVERAVPTGMAPAEAAVRALVAGPSQAEAMAGYRSRIPAGTSINRLSITDKSAEVDLSQAVLVGLDEGVLLDMFEQFKTTLGDFDSISSIRLMSGGKLLSTYLPPTPQIGVPAATPIATSAVGLNGKKICIGPSHGRYWDGTQWAWQRTDDCSFGDAALEDTNSIRLMQFLKLYLTQDGATVTVPRQLDESDCCNTDAGLPWWKMCASSWLNHLGYSSSIWAAATGVGGSDMAANRYNDDIRARPLFADLQGSDLYIACHTNAGGTNHNANGTETFRDTAMEHPAWVTASLNLANAVQSSVISTIRGNFPGEPSWSDRGVKDSAGGFGEIRIPNRPAVLVELAFHDNCTRDALYLTDDFFRSLSEWAVYKGICTYFGNTPTWDKYSCEYVSDTIPVRLTVGQVCDVSITFRNRGVCWFTPRGFRLGAMGGSDPFTSLTKIDIDGEVKPGSTYTFNFTMVAPTTQGDYVSDWRMTRDGYASFGPILSKTVKVRTLTDTMPPTVPQNLRITGITSSGVDLAWDASTDEYAVTGYRIYRDGVQIGTSWTPSYTDSDLTDNTTYTYQVDAYDAIPNYSAKSAPVSGTTSAIILQDGFSDANNWTLDSSVTGNTAPVYSTAQNHAAISGDGSLLFQAGSPQFVYHDLSSSLSAGGYKTGKLSGWIFDGYGEVSGLRSGLRACLYDASGSCKAIYWIGTTDSNPPDLATHYIGAIFNGAWTYFDLGARSIDWHQLAIEILPYTGSNDLKFYIDGGLACTGSQPLSAANASVRRVYLGYDDNVNQDAYYDDVRFESFRPVAPTNLIGTALSPTSIRWSFTDNANNEIGDKIYNGASLAAQSGTINATYVDETGLLPNTTYARTVKAYAGVLESTGADGTGKTLSAAPSASTLTCDKAAGVWQSASSFTFTAVGGFGQGTVDHYQVVWDQQAAHTWTGSESVWSRGDSVQTATPSALGWYFHVKGYNLANQANGTLDLGPFYYDSGAPVISSVTITPPMAAIGDALHTTVAVTDDVGVVSVTANGVALVKSGSSWVGDVVALNPIGVNYVTVIAKDAADNSITNAAGSYKSAKVVMLSTAVAWVRPAGGMYGTFLFKFWGKVTEMNDNYFYVNDGSNMQIMVHAPGYRAKIHTGDNITVRGILYSSGAFESSVDWIVKY